LTLAGYYVARDGRDFHAAVGDGRLAAFHCLEGGFSIEDAANVKRLATWGIGYVTLAHLLFRGIAACVNAFPFFSDAEFERMFPMPVDGLTATGRDICVAMCRHGIIPDVTHMTVRAASEVYGIAQANRPRRPIIVSHGAPQGDTDAEYKLNLTQDVIRMVRESEGVIGVIFFDHWLLPPSSRYGSTAKIDHVIAAMKRIADVAGTTDCIAIGSDFEGFIRPVKRLENVEKIRRLETALRKAFDDERQVEGIMWKNATRTLHAGWG
jgi:membrane dipeptidase